MLTWSEAGLSLAAGGLTTLSPCVFPLLPLVLGGSVRGPRAAPLAMGAGMALSFAALGLLLGVAGESLGLDPDSVRLGAAVLLMGFALVMLVPALHEGFARLSAPLASAAQSGSSALRHDSLGGAFMLGGLLGLIWSPCSGPLLGSALSLVATQGGAARGTVVLGLFGLGAALPLVAVAYVSQARFSRMRHWVLTHANQSRRLMGWVLLAVGLAIATGADHWLETRVNQLLPDSWLALTTRF